MLLLLRLLLRVCFSGGIGAMMCRIGGRGVRTLCMWETFLLFVRFDGLRVMLCVCVCMWFVSLCVQDKYSSMASAVCVLLRVGGWYDMR